MYKIKHEYVLMDEIGPAHKKTFFIQLKLGSDTDNEEAYTASGSSIKKTQHAAAELALKNTKFKKPEKRDITNFDSTSELKSNEVGNGEIEVTMKMSKSRNGIKASNPPTVRLNTLAMKLGLVANYTHSISSLGVAGAIDYKSNLHGPSNDFSGNYTNFMSNDYKPFKYSPVQAQFSSGNSLMGDFGSNRTNFLNNPRMVI